MSLGASATNIVLYRLAGRSPGIASRAFIGQNISIGRCRATIQLSYRDDTPGQFHLAASWRPR